MSGEVNIGSILASVASAMWREEAIDAGTPLSVAKGRTPEAFWEQSPDLVEKWLKFARVAISTMRSDRNKWKARAEKAEAFIAEFAEFKFTEAPRPHIRDPQDEPDQYVDAQEVWAWQTDAKELLK